MLIQTWHQDIYSISNDKTKLDLEVIHQFLANSYWAKGRTIDIVKHSIENSLCFGLYNQNQQIGFARIVTDFVLFANLLDVFVLRSYQGRGLGKWLINTIFSIEELKNIKTWKLDTKDAHGLYKKVGFKNYDHPERAMVRKIKEEG